MTPATHTVLLPLLKQAVAAIEKSQSGFAASRADAAVEADVVLSQLGQMLSRAAGPTATTFRAERDALISKARPV